jgi:ligand-binding sensor domain-containing protein
LRHGAHGENPQLGRVELREDEKTLEITAVLSRPDGSLLLATNTGLRAYDPTARRLSKLDINAPARPVRSLARDGHGRLWLGCNDGLRMVEPGGQTPESFDRVPWIRSNKVESVVPDPSHADGVIVALGQRGVAFVRARREP